MLDPSSNASPATKPGLISTITHAVKHLRERVSLSWRVLSCPQMPRQAKVGHLTVIVLASDARPAETAPPPVLNTVRFVEYRGDRQNGQQTPPSATEAAPAPFGHPTSEHATEPESESCKAGNILPPSSPYSEVACSRMASRDPIQENAAPRRASSLFAAALAISIPLALRMSRWRS